ncbi:MFS transporter [Burkholderia metallica]|uniref:MFS transporter n=1 Tax=Burkholderia metallica TaxID=488729 RepID=UPI00157B4F47|nr:MFS transporter [Burkholderia metallica]NTZ82958.1 MFS transporter [Burkholderia metallica]
MSMSAQKPDAIDVAATIDAQPVGAFQKRLMALIALCVVIDGYDVQSMGFVAPALIASWHVSRAAMGPVFGASLVGMLIGALAMGPLADRVGRRPVLLGCTAFVGAMMIATAFAGSLAHLLALRFLTGCGLGGIMGNAVALVSEYSPARKRATLTMWVSCGFTLGAAFGGVVSAVLIPLAGWRAVFALGGAVPLLIATAMMFALPESMQFLIARDAHAERIGVLLQRVAPAVHVAAHTRFVAPARTHEGNAVAALFADGRARVTVLAWGVNFMNLLNLFFLANWLPTLAIDFGYGLAEAAVIGTTLQVGGVIGTLVMGPLIDRWGFFRVLIPAYLVATVTILSISHVAAVSLAMLLAVVAASGFTIVGGQPANNALSAALYPVTLRATGVGWSLGIGRAGSIVGPIVAGALMQLHWSAQQLFCAAAVPALLSAVMLYAMSRERRLAPTRKPSTEAA